MRSVLLCLFIAVSFNCYGQWDASYKMPNKPARIPFDYINDFIVVNITIKGFPLKFILDTGAENTIILKKEIADLFGIEYTRRIQIMGADLSQELYAQSLINVPIKFDEEYRLRTNLIVLEEDFLEIDGIVGTQIHGILGSNILKNFTLEIDYRSQYLTLISPGDFTPPTKGYSSLPMGLQKNKPYLITPIVLDNKDTIEATLLLDTGASLGTLLYITDNNQIDIPENFVSGTLGMGLGGSLMGYLGRLNHLTIGDYEFNQLISNFQKIDHADSILFDHEKDGLIGNIILKRFDLIFDYSENTLYLKPNRNFKKKIRYDKSGLILIKDGPYLENIRVLNVISGSPADNAGIQPGDEVSKYGIWPVSWVSYQLLLRRLSGKVGKKINLTILRDDEKKRVTFKLRDLI